MLKRLYVCLIKKEQKSSETTEKKETEDEDNDEQRIEEPLEKEIIDQFTDNMMPGQIMPYMVKCVT